MTNLLRTVLAVTLTCGTTLSVHADQGPPPPPVNPGVYPGFWGTGINTLNTGVSASGAIVVGQTSSATAYRWDRIGYTQGMLNPLDGSGIGDVGQTVFPGVNGVSADGLVTVGAVYPGTNNGLGDSVRWNPTAAGTAATYLASANGNPATDAARASNFDGSIIVGYQFFYVPAAGAAAQRPVRWVNGAPSQMISPSGYTFGEANGVNSNGDIIVGYSFNVPAYTLNATIWNNGVPTAVGGIVPGGASSFVGVNPVGNLAVGYAFNGTADVAVVYDPAAPGFSVLPALAGTTSGLARDASTNWDVVGSMNFGAGGSAAFLWNTTLGTVDLNSYLASLGFNLTGWNLTSAYAISSDGLTIVGGGTHFGQMEGWVVTIPAPGAAAVAGLSLIPALRRRRS